MKFAFRVPGQLDIALFEGGSGQTCKLHPPYGDERPLKQSSFIIIKYIKVVVKNT